MTRQWKPGDVARFTGRQFDGIVFRYQPLDTDDAEWISAEQGGAFPEPEELRPLLVIDPEDREQVKRVADTFFQSWDIRQAAASEAAINALQVALRSLLDPRPAEPKGLGAVVRDGRGCDWVRVSTITPWIGTPDDGDRTYIGFRAWGDIDAVEVLSEGVEVES